MPKCKSIPAEATDRISCRKMVMLFQRHAINKLQLNQDPKDFIHRFVRDSEDNSSMN